MSVQKKTLKEIMMPLNCGLDALSKIADLKNVSAFTLIHLGRDNGLNLFFFKVNDLADLPRVQRPAIFHQKDHFVYVRNGEPMPDGEYTGHIIGSAVLGRVLSMAEAKTISGGKNFLTGKNSDGDKVGGGALGVVLGAVGAVVGSVLLPGVGTALGTSLSSAAGGAIGGAIGGGVGSGAVGDNALIGAGLGAIGGYGIGGAVGSIGAGSAASGASGGLTGALGPSGNALNSALYTGANAASGGVSGALGAGGNAIANFAAPASFASSIASGAAAPTLQTAFSQAANSGTGANFAGQNYGLSSSSANPSNFNVNSYQPNSSFTTQGLNIPGISSTPTSSAGQIASNGGFLSNVGKTATDAVGKAFTSNPIGTAATAIGALGTFGSQPPAYTGATPTQNYATTSQFLGPNALEKPTTDQLSSYITTPIEDLAKTFTGTSTRVSDAINQAYDNQKQQLTHQYAQAGQNLAGSSELQDKISQLEQKRSTDLSNAALEAQNAGIGQAIQIKQQALSQGLQSGQFNQTLAMQLATLTGDQQNLQYAIANNDYQSFQQIMGKLMTMGIPQNVNLTNASSLTK